MDEFEALKQWTAKGYDVSIRYGATFEPPDKLNLQWTCDIHFRSIGSIHFFPIPHVTGTHSTDPIQAIRAALIQAQMELSI